MARGFGAPRRYPWSAVQRMRVVRTRRWGRETALLEIDVLDPAGQERLLLFGRLDLDADPDEVERELGVLRASVRPPVVDGRRPERTALSCNRAAQRAPLIMSGSALRP